MPIELMGVEFTLIEFIPKALVCTRYALGMPIEFIYFILIANRKILL